MANSDNFVGYEYKNITVKRDAVTVYSDCLSNFGWILTDEQDFHHHPVQATTRPVNVSLPDAYPHNNPPDGVDMVSLKFKRDRRINNKLELNRLERKCEDALSAIGSLERKNSAYTMGIALGAGIVGTGFLALAVYNFMSANPLVGVLLAIIGVAGWGVGFLAHLKVSKKKSTQTEPMIQEQLEIAYSACEQAHALLA